MNTTGPDRPDPTDWYEIRLQGRLASRWSAWLADMTVTSGPDDTTVLRGPVVDQAALHGLLARVRDLGVPLLSITRLEPEPTRHATPSEPLEPSDPSTPSTGERP